MAGITKDRKSVEALEPRMLLSAAAFGTISGNAFIDYNGNGAQDAGEPGAGQLQIYVDLNGDGIRDKGDLRATTNAQGAFTIRRVPVGTYNVIALPSGAQQVTAPSSDAVSVTVVTGQVSSGVVFGVDDRYPIALSTSSSSSGQSSGSPFTIYPLDSGSDPTDIIVGPDGNLYGNSLTQNYIYQVTLPGIITQFTIPNTSAGAGALAVGSDKNIWYVQAGTNSIGAVSTAGAFNNPVSIPTPNSNPVGIAQGPDGNIWFTESSGNKIGTIQAGIVQEYPVPTPSSQPTGIASSSDGNLWFVESAANKIARITTSGVVTEYPLAVGQGSPQQIVQGPDRNMWFTLDNPGAIGVITESGAITVYPTQVAGSAPQGIILGGNGVLDFADSGANAIGQITGAGQITETHAPSVLNIASQPQSLALASDGSIWITQPGESVIDQYKSPSAQTLTLTAKKLTSAHLLDFTDADPAASVLNYKVSITWGDGSKPVAVSARRASAGLFSVISSHRYATAGVYSVTVVVTDIAGSQLTETLTANVT